MTAKVLLPFRYPGGKYYALSILEPFWTKSHDEYREPMVGGGAVFFAKNKVKFNWINDLHSDLILTYKIMADPKSREELVALTVKETASKERHSEIKKMVPKNDLERAFRFFYLNRTSFSGKVKEPYWGYRPKRSLPPNRWNERIVECGKKLEGIKITNLDFEQLILEPPQGEKVLLFLDPPYFGIERLDHYTYLFTKKDHIRLCNLLQETSYDFILTYDDIPEVRELYSWAYTYPVSFFYRIGNSEEINGKREKGSELVITNFKVPKGIQSTLDVLTGNQELPQAANACASFGEYIKPTRSVQERRKNFEMPSPFRYPGGKLLACRFIRPFWEVVSHDEYREPFVGSGAVFFAKPLAKINWLNDSDSDLMNTYLAIADAEIRRKMIKLLELENPTKERHAEYKMLKPKDSFEAALRYYFLNRTSYSGIMNNPAWGYRGDKSATPDKWGQKMISAGNKLGGVKLTNVDFSEVIQAPPEGKSVLMFIDPPYFASDQKRAYSNHFNIEDHERLCDLLKKTTYTFILTYDDYETIRTMYKWANVHPFSWQYNTANKYDEKRSWGNELIITNF